MDNLPKQAIMLLITSQNWGGAQLFIFELAQELQQKGEKVIVAAGRQKNASKSGDLESKCLEAGVNFKELKYVARDINPISNLLSILELWKLFIDLKPSVVHLNSTMMGVVGSFAAVLARVPKKIYCIGGWVFNEDLPSWKKNLYIWIERISANWKDVIVTVHPGDEYLAKKLKIRPQKQLATIPNGIDVTEFESGLLTREKARETLGIHQEAIIVGTVANAYPPKNLLWYLGVCKKIHEADERINFVIIGEGPQFEELATKQRELRAESYVMLAGKRMDAPTLYKAFDLFALPSSKEGMSITLLEAMAARVPIVATDVGAAKWMLKDAALIVAPNNKDQLCKTILELVDDKFKKSSLADKAYDTVSKSFVLQKTLTAHIKEITD